MYIVISLYFVLFVPVPTVQCVMNIFLQKHRVLVFGLNVAILIESAFFSYVEFLFGLRVYH